MSATDILDFPDGLHEQLRRRPFYFENVLEVTAGPGFDDRVLDPLPDFGDAVAPGEGRG